MSRNIRMTFVQPIIESPNKHAEGGTSMEVQISCDLIRAAKLSEGETKDWSPLQIRETVERYNKYFALMAENPGRCVAPTREIDAIWHLHMQSPCAYYRDCIAACGHIIDHNGGFGHSEDELPKLMAVFEDTAARWEQKYGVPYRTRQGPTSATNCWHNCVSRCHNACSSVATHA
jgi:hypothetical protein